MRGLAQRDDPPRAPGITEHHPQHLRGPWPEERLELAAFDGRLVRDHAFDEDSIKSNPGIALEVEEADLLIPAQRLRLGRQIRCDEDRRRIDPKFGDGVSYLE